METLLALGLFGLLAAVGWSLTDRDRGDARGPAPRPLLPPAPPPPTPTSQDPSSGVGVAREHEVADDVTNAGITPPGLAAWASLLAPLSIPANIQLPYVLKWIDIESGGNPCDIGHPQQKGPDGLPREMGIAQFYNPDDLHRMGVSGTALRAYCVPGDQHQILYKGKIVRGFSKALLRPLTAAEMAQQAHMTIDLIVHSVADASRDLEKIRAGAGWSRSGRDFWKLVKLQHGLPGLSRSGLPAVAQKLGRPPRDWREFRDTLASVRLDAGTEAKRSIFSEILDNAEQCASVFSERGVA